MDSLVSWCGGCGADAVFDPVPDATAEEYVCRGCDAAVVFGDPPLIDTPLIFAAA